MQEVLLMRLSEIKKLPPTFARQHFSRRFAAAARYRFAADRLRSFGAGALIWYAFGDVESEIKKGPYGKPFLEHAGREFNLSHSGEFVVMACAPCPIGVDVEHCTEKNLVAAKRVYTERERAWMQEEPLARFEQLWTLKESVMKAVGKGFQLEPGSFDVLELIAGNAKEIDGVKLYGFTTRFENYTLSVAGCEPIKTLQIKEILAEDILMKEKNAKK